MAKFCLLFTIVQLFSSYHAIIRNQECQIANAVFSSVYKLRLNEGIFETINDIARPELCVKNCVWNFGCKSINYNNGTQVCELLERRLGVRTKKEKLDYSGGWVHYSDKAFQKNAGPICEKLNPCGDGLCMDVCHSPGYTCNCIKHNGTPISDDKSCISFSMNKCSQLRGMYESTDATVSVTQNNVNNYAQPVAVVNKGGVNTRISLTFSDTMCSKGTGTDEHSKQRSFSYNYKECQLSIEDYVDNAYRKDCGYQHCKKLVGVYDKGKILSSLFGLENGLKVTVNENGLTFTGPLFQVESTDPERRCLGYVSHEMNLVRQNNNCTIVWQNKDGAEDIWTRDTPECTS